jgi:hypothetical protein
LIGASHLQSDFWGQGSLTLDLEEKEPTEELLLLKDRPGKKDKAKGLLKVIIEFKAKTSRPHLARRPLSGSVSVVCRLSFFI